MRDLEDDDRRTQYAREGESDLDFLYRTGDFPGTKEEFKRRAREKRAFLGVLGDDFAAGSLVLEEYR